ncbi:MAG: hypothetical protein AB7I32_02445 [Gammaproteobacteria bacterium]
MIQPTRSAFAAALVLICAAAAAAPPLPDVDHLAALMRRAVVERGDYPDLDRLHPALDVDTLYAVQARYVAAQLADGARIGGFKGGLVPVAPIGGVLLADGLLERPARVSRAAYRRLLVEAEIAFELCTPVTAPLADVAAVQAAVCRLRPAVELPDAALADLDVLKTDPPRLARALIPNNMVTQAVALGAAVPAAKIDLKTLHVQTLRDGVLLGERAPGAPNEAMWETVRWIVNEFALKRGYRVEAGHLVMAGNLTGLHAGDAGRWRVDYGALGSVAFEVGD